MSKDPRAMVSARPPIGRQWQFPLLLFSTAMFGAGLVRALPRRVEPSPESLLARGEQLIAAEKLDEAYRDLGSALARPSISPELRAKACRLMADALYTVESSVRQHVPARVDRIIQLLSQASRTPGLLGGRDYLHWADAVAWTGHEAESMPILREALHAGISHSGAVRRRLIELRLACGATFDEVGEDLRAQLDDRSAEPGEGFWALERLGTGLLETGRGEEVLAAVERVLPQLKGTEFAAEAEWWACRGLVAMDRLDEAERRLSSLLNRGGPRDDLWARISLGLASIYLRRDKPDLAKSVFDAVCTEYPAGPHFVAAQFGRARCAFAKGRYAEAVQTYRQVFAMLDDPRTSGELSRGELQTTLSAHAAVLNAAGRPRDGVTLLHMARLLVPDERSELRAAHAAQEASLLLSLAESGEAQAAGDDAIPTTREGLYAAAGEAFLTVAASRSMSDDEMAETLWRAMDAFDAAGQSQRSEALLEQFVEKQTRGPRQAAALLRLARARQAGRQYRGAAQVYERILREYPRTQEGLQSVAPLASCLIALGGDEVRRAERLLIHAVDEAPDEEAYFDPRLPEYGDALFVLAGLLLDEEKWEPAISRLEAFRTLAPHDPRRAVSSFLLARAYQRSGGLLRAQRDRADGLDRRAEIEREALSRLARAEQLYDEFIRSAARRAARRAGESPELDQARIRIAWLNRADCLFDAGRIAEAREVYAEAAWRFDGELTSLTASMRVVHCDLRLGQPARSDAALRRLWWMVRKMPDEAFAQAEGSADRAYWLEWIDRMLQSTGS